MEIQKATDFIEEMTEPHFAEKCGNWYEGGLGMELAFHNTRGTPKFCVKTDKEDIWDLSKAEVDRLLETLNLNDGYTWLPVETGFAKDKKIPLIP